MDQKFDDGPTPVIAGSTNYPPPPAYQSQPPQPTVIIQPVLNQALMLGKDPAHVTCPTCKAQVITRVNYKSGGGTWLICIGLCFIGCDLGCQFIPFCVDSCKDSHHYCPNCNAFLGRKTLI
ncbi:lipopolysaccharide-induced tumor necrosis factor-alpha factor [Brachionus plicatilis]|uniref:Lipopolysaccharide-induced tumor necrosis factor-alpha factor n=1 Tax=Brachionus plicatilis TaxID=10195 RepID=A0A3M7Q7W8_BRAPC|nr:lipopolysaccharide-induced tumor necrosis factor-alpha factor [Brachionus plicatilis]